jgi:beta-N-acetylhexosaminidase
LWLSAVLLFASLAGCWRGDTAAESWARQTHAGLSLRAHAGQIVFAELPDLRLESPERVDALLARASAQLRRDSVGGVSVSGLDAESAVRVVARLREAAALPILVGGPVDRGLASTVNGATEYPLVAAIGGVEPDAMRRAGRLVAREANAVGIDLVVLRHLGKAVSPEHPWDSEAAAACEYLRGITEGGLLAVWPAFAPASDTAAGLGVATWDHAWLEAGELAALRQAIAAGVAGVLMPPIAVPSLSGDSVLLPFAAPVVSGLLRRDLEFGGLIGVELGADLTERYGSGEAAVRAIGAGADLLLGIDQPVEVIDALVAAVEAGRLPRTRLEEASWRVLQAKAKRGLHRQGVAQRRDVRRELRRVEAERLASELFEMSTLVLGLPAPEPQRPDLRVTLLTRPGEGAVLADALAQIHPGLRHLVVDGDGGEQLARAISESERLFYAGFPGSDRPLAEVIRAAGGVIGSETVEFRFLESTAPVLPLAAVTVFSPGSGPQAQRAAARALAGRGARAEMTQGKFRWPPAPMLQHAPAAEAGLSEAGLARADALLRQGIVDGLFPGAALAVGRRGKLVRQRGYGHVTRDPNAAPVDPNGTLYDLASLTKVVAAAAAAKVLVGDGRLELDAPVSRYLQEWSPVELAAADDGIRNRITVRQLLAHTAGLPAGLAIHGNADSPRQARQLLVGAPVVLEPGSVALYSDVGPIILGELLERVAGEPLDVFLARTVFRPLGMAATMYLPPLALRERTAPSAQTAPDEFELQGIVHDGTAFRLGGVAGHAGLFSTARDLAVYAQTILNDGAYGVRQVFDSATVASFRVRQGGTHERALGWDTPAPESSAGSYFSENSFGHTGFTGTSIWIDPDQDLFVVLLTNRTYDRTSLLRMRELRQRLHDAVAQSILDAPVRRRPGAVDPVRLPSARARR